MEGPSNKAIEEIAKTTGQAFDLVKSFGSYIASVLGDAPSNAVEAWAGQSLRSRRLIKGMELWAKVTKKAEELGIDQFGRISPKLFIPLMDNATLEDDADIDEMWANLLLSAMNPKTDQIQKKYISILADFTFREVALLKYISRSDTYYSKKTERDGVKTEEIVVPPQGKKRPYHRAELNEVKHVNDDTIRAFLNFGIFSPDLKWFHPGGQPSRDSFPVHRDIFEVNLTEFGLNFIERVISSNSAKENKKCSQLSA